MLTEMNKIVKPPNFISREYLEGLSKPELIDIILNMAECITELENKVARLSRDSTNSSKPPSSDIVKPPKIHNSDREVKRKIGAQPGHIKHEPESLPLDAIDRIRDYHLAQCPDCGGALFPADNAPRIIRQIEIKETPIEIQEHRGHAYWCQHCRKVHYAPLPAEVEKGGLFGARLTTFVAYLKGATHTSYSTIQKFLRDVFNIRVSRGYLCNLTNKVSQALAKPYEEILGLLPSESRLNVDETGHKENGKLLWTWCFRANLYALFKIEASRGSEVLIKVLGQEFQGVLGCDYFSAYRKYMKDFGVAVQFCLAHLIRDVKFLITLPDEQERVYGKGLLDGLRKLFEIIHQKEQMKEDEFERSLSEARQQIMDIALGEVPTRPEAQKLAKRFKDSSEAYFRFITTPGVEPTNNLVEQALRFVVIDRLVTQGTRGEKGRKWNERIWTVMATCAQRGYSSFDFMLKAVKAHFNQEQIPSLLPMPP